MSRFASIESRTLLTQLPLLLACLASTAAAVAGLSESHGGLPLHFETNQGQVHKDVRFLARGPAYSVYLTPGEAVLVLSTNAKAAVLRMSLAGTGKPLVSGLGELPGKVNYLVGKDQANWRTDVPTYAQVRYQNVYPGIDLIYYGNQRQLEYDFVVAPGADPARILLEFKGADQLAIDAEGNLVLRVDGGSVRQHKPVVYQEVDGIRREIDGDYELKGAMRVGFRLASYDHNRPLVIDPVLSYSTYLGGGGEDVASAIAVDASGNAYVTGATSSVGFPTSADGFRRALAGSFDVFVTKLDSAGALVYSTYLGGGGADRGQGIAVDSGGNAVLTGSTDSVDFPATAGAFQPSYGGGMSDAFVVKLDPTGSALVYSSYLGGSGEDVGLAIAVDSAGAAYVTGYTDSPAFPTSAGAFQRDAGGDYDAFAMKLGADGSAPAYFTYLGGGGKDYGRAIAVDAGGSAYLAGSTNSLNFPTTSGAFRSSFSGGFDDPFVAKLDPGGGIVYSTYLGGSNNDRGSGIAVDASGNAHVVGSTWSRDFPTTPAAFQPVYGGGRYDAYVAKLNATGSGLVYSTFLGGIDLDYGQSIALDPDGNAYVTGNTYSINFPTTLDALKPVYGGGSDAFVTKLDPSGSGLLYSSYLGGNASDYGWGIAVDAAAGAYVAGVTSSTDFPTTAGAFQSGFGGGVSDAFVAKVGGGTAPAATTRSEESAASQVGAWTTYGSETGTFSGGTIVASNTAASTAVFQFTGTAISWIGVKCNVCGIATVSVDGAIPSTVDTAGPVAPGGLTSEVVFSASGLDPAATHTMAITVTGTTSAGGAYVALDAFDVTNGGAAPPILPSVVLPPPPPIVPPLPAL